MHGYRKGKHCHPSSIGVESLRRRFLACRLSEAGAIFGTWLANSTFSMSRSRGQRGLNLTGIRPAHLSSSCHTAASLFLDKNVPIHQVSAVLGHATPAVTHQTYSHVIGAVGEATAAVVSLMYDNPQDDDSDTATGLRDTAS